MDRKGGGLNPAPTRTFYDTVGVGLVPTLLSFLFSFDSAPASPGRWAFLSHGLKPEARYGRKNAPPPRTTL